MRLRRGENPVTEDSQGEKRFNVTAYTTGSVISTETFCLKRLGTRTNYHAMRGTNTLTWNNNYCGEIDVSLSLLIDPILAQVAAPSEHNKLLIANCSPQSHSTQSGNYIRHSDSLPLSLPRCSRGRGGRKSYQLCIKGRELARSLARRRFSQVSVYPTSYYIPPLLAPTTAPADTRKVREERCRI